MLRDTMSWQPTHALLLACPLAASARRMGRPRQVRAPGVARLTEEEENMNVPRRWHRPLSVLLVVIVLAGGGLLAAGAMRQMAPPAPQVVAEWCSALPGPC